MELVTLGTGERLKRTTLPEAAPKKPERRNTPKHTPSTTPAMERKLEKVKTEEDEETETQVEGDAEPGDSGLMYMNLTAEGEVDSAEGEIDEAPWDGGGEEGEGRDGTPREQAKDRVTSRRVNRQREKIEQDRERQEERVRRQREKKDDRERKLKEKSKSPPPPEASNSPALPPRERGDSLTNGEHEKEEKKCNENAAKAAEVVMTTRPNDVTACGQPIAVAFDTRGACEGSLTAVCKGTKTNDVETTVREESPGQYWVRFTPEVADMFMLSVCWSGCAVPGSPFLINLNLLPPAIPTADSRGEGEDGKKREGEVEQSGSGHVEVKKEGEPGENGLDGERGGENDGEEGTKEGEVTEDSSKRSSREMREKSPVIVVSDEDPFDMAYAASRLLGEFLHRTSSSHWLLCFLSLNCSFFRFLQLSASTLYLL